MRRRTGFPLVIAVAVTTACAAPDAGRGGRFALALDSVPALDLGAESGGPREEFAGFVHPVRLGNGTIVVANGGSQELRMFDSTGAWLRSVGRDGEGPGEFRRLGWLHAGPGDTLRTYDWSLRRLTVFAPDGAFQRSTTLTMPGDRVGLRPVGVLEDGRLVLHTQGQVDFTTQNGVVRDTTTILLYDATGAVNDTLGSFAGSEAWVIHTQTGTSRGVSVQNRPFGKDVLIAAEGRLVYVGTADGPEVQVLAADGATRRTIRWGAAAQPVSAADIAAYKAISAEGWLPGTEARRDRALARLENAPYAETKPAYSGGLVSSDGSIWIRRFTIRADGAGATFDVFDPSGAALGEFTMPARFTPTQVTPAYVLGTWRDADDVTHVRMYRFRRTP